MGKGTVQKYFAEFRAGALTVRPICWSISRMCKICLSSCGLTMCVLSESQCVWVLLRSLLCKLARPQKCHQFWCYLIRLVFFSSPFAWFSLQKFRCQRGVSFDTTSYLKYSSLESNLQNLAKAQNSPTTLILRSYLAAVGLHEFMVFFRVMELFETVSPF